MGTEVFDAIIVGAGQAGPAIAARCSREGLKTAVIERHHFGGTCVNVGCVPTKTLVASARAVRLAQRGAEFGFDVADLRVDMARVMARKEAIVLKSREGVEAWMRGLKGTEVIIGDAHFVGPATLEASGRPMTCAADDAMRTTSDSGRSWSWRTSSAARRRPGIGKGVEPKISVSGMSTAP